MALDPETIARELEKIPRFDVSGSITYSKLLKKDNECLHTYESTLDTGQEQITFLYSVLVDICTTDSIFEIEEKPFSKNTQVNLNLTQEEPHRLVTSDVRNIPSSLQSSMIYGVGAVVLLLLIAGIIMAVIKKRRKRTSP